MYADLSIHVDGGPEATANARSDAVQKTIDTLALGTAACWATYDYLERSDDEHYTVCQEGNDWPVLLCMSSFIFARVFTYVEIYAWIPQTGIDRKLLKVPMNLEFTMHRLGTCGVGDACDEL